MSKTKLCLGLTMLAAAAFAQWIRYPIPGTPRTKDGKANLTAPAPKTDSGTFCNRHILSALVLS
jgi:hypothetical protein